MHNNSNHKYLYQAINLFVVIICFLIILSACSRYHSEGTENESVVCKGRYIEKTCELPNIKTFPSAINALSNGILRMLTPEGVFDSSDEGTTWHKSAVQQKSLDKLLDGSNPTLNVAAISKKGCLFFGYTKNNTTKYYFTDEKGEPKELPLYSADNSIDFQSIPEDSSTGKASQNHLIDAMFTDSGDLLAADDHGTIIQFDLNTNMIKANYNRGYHRGDKFTSVGDKLIVIFNEQADFYDLNTHMLLEKNDALNKFLSKESTTPSESLTKNTACTNAQALGLPEKITLFSGSDSKTLFLCNSTGIYSFIMGGNITEQILDGKINLMGNPNYTSKNAAIIGKNTFLILYSTDGIAKLYRYYYDKNIPSLPDK